MLRWKLVRYLIAFGPIILLFLTPILDPIKKQVINRYDLRWYVSHDQSKHIQQLAVYNNGEVALSKLVFQIDLPIKKVGTLSDFGTAAFDFIPHASFLDSFTQSTFTALTGKEDFRTIRPVIDEHSNNRSLIDIDGVFDSVRLKKFKETKAPRDAISNFIQQVDTHASWFPKCNGDHPEKKVECKFESIEEEWEDLKQELYKETCKKWQETTGITFESQGIGFSNKKKIFFSFPLGSDESRYIEISYGPSSIDSIVSRLHSMSNKHITQVSHVEDLKASTFWILVCYHTVEFIIALGLLVCCLVIARPALRPIRLMETYQIFNFAAETNDPDAWEAAFKKHRYYIMRKFRELCTTFHKQLSLNADDVADYIRDSLRLEYVEHHLTYIHEAHLNGVIDRYLRNLVIRA